jgi:hypothetical protein
MKTLGIENFTIHRPHAGNPLGVNYGIWLQFEKPLGKPERDGP